MRSIVTQMKTLSLIVLAALCSVHVANAQKLQYVAGTSFHVQVDEMLKLTQFLTQVDSSLVEPSFRFTTYHFTEVIKEVRPDGSALVGSTLDSFTTKIFVGSVKDRNEYFRFNSNNEYDLGNRLKDPRALPRAQYLGQTLEYVLDANGLVHHFVNLSSFQAATIGRSYDYDMMHAMMAFADSLRVGQLLEMGNGVFAAIANRGKVALPYTVTEIHLTKELSTKVAGSKIGFTARFVDPPAKTDYLEGISYPINVKDFKGGSFGSVSFKSGIVTAMEETDTASMQLFLDTEQFTNSIYRTVSIKRTPNTVLHGVDINIREINDSTTSLPQTHGKTGPDTKSEPHPLEPITTPPGH
ncbi:MAG: hypothetical protein JSS75_08375 [Bacteroidetes bacterium]|nr:hypothetical protein [Bacteroidota bacterium]